MKVAFVANLAADLELRDSDGFAPGSRLLTEIEAQARTLRASLSAHVEVVPLQQARGVLGQAWCPTPSATVQLAGAGAVVPEAPALEVLQQVNHRAFAADLGQMLRGAAFVRSIQELEAVLAEPSAGDGYLLKRPFGFAGRDRKRVGMSLTASERTWAEASMTQYGQGLQVEPFVARSQDLAVHGRVPRSGKVRVGVVTEQQTDDRGRWLAATSRPVEEPAVLTTAHETGEALAAAGYHGPFGIDAFRWRDRSGDIHLCRRCDINARYSMGYFLDPALRTFCPWLAKSRRT